MMPRLRAEEQLARVNAASLGSGNMKKRDHDRAMRQLERAAGGRAKAPAATPDMLRTIGIRVVEVPPSRKVKADG